MEKTYLLNRPIQIGRGFNGKNEIKSIDSFTFKLRTPDDEPDQPGLAVQVARAVTDESGNSPTVAELAEFALAEGIKAAVRPFWQGLI